MSNISTNQRRPSWWDLVGLAFTRYRRCMYLAAWTASGAPGADLVPEALYDVPHVLMHWLGVAGAWI